MIGTSEYKHVPNFTGEKKNEDHESLIKEENNYTLDMFLNIVMTSRPNLNVNLIKTAKVWYGQDALKNNLVDELNNIDDYLLELTKDEKNNIYVLFFEEKEKDELSISDILKKFIKYNVKSIL
jgi:ClpP class serine protease